MTANDSKSTPKKAEDATRHPLALLDALLWQMNRDRPSTGDLLPNRAGEERRAKAELIQGYIDALEPILAALRAQAEADRGLEVGWANRVRLDWDDFSAFSKVLFFALHSTHSSRARLQNFTDLTDDQLQQLVRLCEDYEQRAHALAQAGGEG